MKRQSPFPSPWSQETVDYGLEEARAAISEQRMSAATENKVLEAYDTLSQAITHLDEWMAELGAENLRSNEAVEQVKKAIGFDSLSGGVTALQGDGSLQCG
eukprot:4269237-Amphidinium_carterae.1